MMFNSMPQTVAIVGAGRVGKALGACLRELGWSIGAVATTSEATARAAVRAIGSGCAHGSLTRRIVGADVVLIASPDQSIAEIAKQLACLGGQEWRGKVVLHTSGTLDHTVLGPLARCGAATGSMHPLQTFSGYVTPDLSGSIFALEGDRAALRVARRMVEGFGGIPIRLAGRDKPAYHVAAAMAAGHVLSLIEASTRILMELGFTRRYAARALLPLTRQTLQNFERIGPQASWTGPVARGDYATVTRHLAALGRFRAEYRQAYAALTRLGAVVLARDPEAKLRELKRVL